MKRLESQPFPGKIERADEGSDLLADADRNRGIARKDRSLMSKHPAPSRPRGESANVGCMSSIVRIQDAEGRGPWRPGFSHMWVRDDTPMKHGAIYAEMPGFGMLVDLAHQRGEHIGCAVRAGRLHEWFSPGDLRRLRDYGFSLVDASRCRVIAETHSQVVIGSQKPLRKLPPLPAPLANGEDGE